MTVGRSGRALLTLSVLGPTLLVPISTWHHHAPAAPSCTAACVPTPRDAGSAARGDRYASAADHECVLCLIASLMTAEPVTPATAPSAPTRIAPPAPPTGSAAYRAYLSYWARGPPSTCVA